MNPTRTRPKLTEDEIMNKFSKRQMAALLNGAVQSHLADREIIYNLLDKLRANEEQIRDIIKKYQLWKNLWKKRNSGQAAHQPTHQAAYYDKEGT